MILFPTILVAVIAFALCLVVLAGILRFASRSSSRVRHEFHHAHRAHVPRFGGLALVITLLTCEVLIDLFFSDLQVATPERYVAIGGALAMFLLGFADDLRPLGAKRKLLGQLAIASTVAFMGVGITMFKLPFTDTIIHLHGWGILFTVIWLVSMTNLINLIDGVDGLAGGISLIMMFLLLYMAVTASGYVLLTAAMAGAILAFLRYNFPPARIYLGDGGAYFLGFLIGVLSLVGSAKGAVFGALAAPLLVLALPIVDVCVAIIRRGVVGLPVFRPDQKHIHHLLLEIGLSRRRVVISIYAVTLFFLVLGIIAVTARGQWLPVLVGTVVGVLLLLAGRFSFSRRWLSVRSNLQESLAIRDEVKYALHMTHWLKLEAERSRSVHEGFEHLCFVARRLGFAGIKLKLADGQANSRLQDQEPGCRMQSVSFNIRGGRGGELELTAPVCPDAGTDQRHCSEQRSCPCIAHPRLLSTVGELMAEGWSHMAAAHSVNGHPLKFGQKIEDKI